MLPDGVKIAPDEVLKMTQCNCVSYKCKTNRCSCLRAVVGFSEFCGCQEFENQKDIHMSEDEIEDDTTDDDESSTDEDE